MSERRSARKRLRVHKHTYDALGGEPYAAEVVEVPLFDKWDEAAEKLKELLQLLPATQTHAHVLAKAFMQCAGSTNDRLAHKVYAHFVTGEGFEEQVAAQFMDDIQPFSPNDTLQQCMQQSRGCVKPVLLHNKHALLIAMKEHMEKGTHNHVQPLFEKVARIIYRARMEMTNI